MKRIISETQRKKIQKRNQIIVGVILVGLMLLSTLGYSFMNNESSEENIKNVNYNGIEFVQKGEFWIAQIADFSVYLSENPNIINKTIFLNISLNVNNYINQPIYLDTQNYIAERLININLGPQYNSIATRIQKACYNSKDCQGDYPIKDCQDNLIIIKESNISEVYSQNNCIFILGNQEEIEDLVNQFLLKIFNI
jgi:hypothetical protein